MSAVHGNDSITYLTKHLLLNAFSCFAGDLRVHQVFVLSGKDVFPHP